MSTVTFTPGPNGIARLEVSAAGSSTPMLTQGMLSDLDTAVAAFVADDSQTGAILVSAAPDRFVEGQDLAAVLAECQAGQNAIEASDRCRRDAGVLRRLETCGKPVVAVLTAPALGPGLEIALACHHRIALDAPEVRFGLTDIALGLLPRLGGSQRLPRIVGIPTAAPMLLEGRTLTAAAALEAGLVDALAKSGEDLIAEALAWLAGAPEPVAPWDIKGFRIPGGAGPLAPFAGETFQASTSRLKATQSRYPAPHAVLSALYEGTLVPFDAAMAIEADYAGEVLSDPVAASLIRSDLCQQAARTPAEARGAKVTVRRLGLLGAGMMGAGIANVAAAVGMEVVLLDRDSAAAARGRDHAAKLRSREVAKGAMTQDAADAILARITPATDVAALTGCDLIIEAVFENRAVKAEASRSAWPMLADGGFFASNTSTLPITGLSADLPDPARFIGLHFFSPVERMPLVEVITGQATSAETLADALAFVAALGKVPIVVHDSPGFYTSRIFCTYIDEAMAMLTEGVAPALVENAARQVGFPVSPLAVADEVSLDLQKLVIDQAHADGLDARFLRSHAAPVVEKLCGLGRLGRKSGGGFYDFAVDGSKMLWPGLADLFPSSADQPSAEDVGNRLLYIQSLESARCMVEGVIDDAATADVASVLGIGFPRWTGGALSLIGTVGHDRFTSRCAQFAERYGARFDPECVITCKLQQK